jgi:phospholipid/cholesterol/gamma-HCH transport system substrate-binding protein
MSSRVRLGAFVLGALIVFGIVSFWIGDERFVFTRTYRISSAFDNVAGLDEGAQVRAGGVRVGTVQRIVLPRQPGERITVEMQLQNASRDVIKKDSVATIETEGLLGAKYAAVSFGSAEAESVNDGDVIESRPPFDYAELARNVSSLIGTTKEAVDSSKVAIGNINDASGDLKSITGKINAGQGTLGALVNDQSAYRNMNETMEQAKAGATSFQENMEALKHNFFLRGFFKKRGYYDSSQLTANAVSTLPGRAPVKEFAFDGRDLFNKPDTAKLRKKEILNQAGAYLEGNQFGLAVIVAGTGAAGEKESNLKLAQARAMVVRQYLAEKFKLDDARLKTMGAGEGHDQSGSVKIVVYPAGRETRVLGAKHKQR